MGAAGPWITISSSRATLGRATRPFSSASGAPGRQVRVEGGETATVSARTPPPGIDSWTTRWGTGRRIGGHRIGRSAGRVDTPAVEIGNVGGRDLLRRFNQSMTQS